MTELYGWPDLSAIIEETLLNTTDAATTLNTRKRNYFAMHLKPVLRYTIIIYI